MIIARLLSSEPWSFERNQVYSVEGADAVIQSGWAMIGSGFDPRRSTTYRPPLLDSRDSQLYTRLSNSGVSYGSQKNFLAAIYSLAGHSCLWPTTKQSQTETAGHRCRRQRHGAGYYSSAP